jgi:hypothetical protein
MKKLLLSVCALSSIVGVMAQTSDGKKHFEVTGRPAPTDVQPVPVSQTSKPISVKSPQMQIKTEVINNMKK